MFSTSNIYYFEMSQPEHYEYEAIEDEGTSIAINIAIKNLKPGQAYSFSYSLDSEVLTQKSSKGLFSFAFSVFKFLKSFFT